MPSPFSGMDPYIESCGLWEECHGHLIERLYNSLVDRVPDHYLVRTGERTYLVLVDETEEPKKHLFKPDVGIAASTQRHGVGATAVLAEPALDTDDITLRAQVTEEFREKFVEIFALEPERRLITCIEFLSPSNKREGTPGWDKYLRKRQALLSGQANLVEIDLLRGGHRMPMLDPFPDCPYYLLVARKSRTPFCTVKQAHYRRPLPAIPVPLEAPDADVSIDLQPMIAEIYARSRYDRDIDYAKPCIPPLPDDDQAWLQQQLAARP